MIFKWFTTWVLLKGFGFLVKTIISQDFVEDNELKLWRMFIAQNVRETDKFLQQVHELPKEHYRRLHKNNEIEAELQAEKLESHKRLYLEQPIVSVLDVINKKQNYKYVILGDPGSGKSTLLQFLALN